MTAGLGGGSGASAAAATAKGPALTIDELRDLLEGCTGRTRTHADSVGFQAHCPGSAHHGRDRNRSLSVGLGEKGIVMKCFVGCAVEDICAALGIELRALFYDDIGRGGGGGGGGRGGIPPCRSAPLQPSPTTPESNGTQGLQQAVHPPCTPATPPTPAEDSGGGCTLAAYAAAKRLPLDLLRACGLSQIAYQGAPAVRMPYRNEASLEVSVRFRTALTKSPEGEDTRFKWKSGSKAMLYGLWRLLGQRTGDAPSITLVEGESDCHTLWYCGVPALGIPGASTWSEERDAIKLEPFATIYVVIEPDAGGKGVKRWLAKSRLRDRVRLVDLGEHKDPSGLFLALDGDPARFLTAWQEMTRGATPWTELEAREQRQEAATAWAACHELAQTRDILGAFARDISADGVVGEERTVKLLYLAVTSRLQEKPVSLVLKGPSSAGKSYTTERVLRYFPASAFYALSAMSERSLAYSDEPIAHRMLVFYEAAGIRGEFATYLLRTLLSEGCVRYDTVEKTAEGMRPRQIVRPGPAGALITTTEIQLHAENETRMLSVPVTDTPEQTRRILLAQARAQEERDREPDRSAWLALQTWLSGQEQRAQVTIPYAALLAEQIPPVAVRLRRDFTLILTLIRAHALLHQATRTRDSLGRIVATDEDYAAVRELVYDLVADGVEATVPTTVRETVQAVAAILADADADQEHPGATGTQVARQLNLDKSAALRRVQTALRRGYLRNLEERKGHAAQLVMGEPMPADEMVLPTVALVQAGCTPCRNGEVRTISEMAGQGCRVAGADGGIRHPSFPPLPAPPAPSPARWDPAPVPLGVAEYRDSGISRCPATPDGRHVYANMRTPDGRRRCIECLAIAEGAAPT